MITIPSVIKTKSTGEEGITLKEIANRFKVHEANIAACNIYFQTIRMLNNTHSNVDRDTFQRCFRDALSDIDLETPPTDAFIPDAEDKEHLFRVNRLAAEYIKITERLPLSLLEEAFGPTNALVILCKHDPKELEKTYDDIFTYFCMFKYIDTIEILRLNMFSNFTPMIEWIVENITLEDWQGYLIKKKPDPEKYAAKCEDTPYVQEVSRLIFAGGIHRLYQSGCKFDDMPVLIGTKQGEGKSTLVRWLAMRDEYFTEVNEFDGQKGI